MEQQKKSRKEWIKTIAIIFLSVLLVLTFFSNTIQNYSLPQVSAQYCMSGTITNKIRGTGVVESADPYSVVVKESRKISSVLVRVGDEVKKGDPIYELEPGESTELKEAEKLLQEYQTDYEKSVLMGQYSKETTDAIEGGEATSREDNQKEITNLKTKAENAKNKASEYTDQIEDIEKLIAQWEDDEKTYNIPEKKTLLDNIANAETAKETWDAQKDATYSEYEKNASELDSLQAAFDEASAAYAAKKNSKNKQAKIDAREALQNCQKAMEPYEKASAEYDAADTALTNANKAFNAKVKEMKDAYQDQIAALTELREAQEEIEADANEKLSKLTESISTEYELKEQYNRIVEQQKVVDKLKEESNGTTFVSPVTGTVLTLPLVAGETTEQGMEIATIQLAGKEFTLSFTISNDQAKLIGIGDEAEITNSWWYSDVQARVKSIKPDQNDHNMKVVTFELSGDVTNGQQLTLTAGRRTANYDCIVPANAVHEDNNGKFILIVNSKSTPLGNRYSAGRVDVTVLAEDDSQCAVSGLLDGWEYVITTSSKPIEDGQLIRLKD